MCMKWLAGGDFIAPCPEKLEELSWRRYGLLGRELTVTVTSDLIPLKSQKSFVPFVIESVPIGESSLLIHYNNLKTLMPSCLFGLEHSPDD